MRKRSKTSDENLVELVAYIRAYKLLKGYCPSYREMAEFMGASTSTVDRAMKILISRKVLERDDVARGIRLL
jgi:hypothetical protein